MKAPSIEAGGEAGALEAEGEEVEYWRCLICIRTLQACSLRVAEHRIILLAIIATSFQCVDLEDTRWEERFEVPQA